MVPVRLGWGVRHVEAPPRLAFVRQPATGFLAGVGIAIDRAGDEAHGFISPWLRQRFQRRGQRGKRDNEMNRPSQHAHQVHEVLLFLLGVADVIAAVVIVDDGAQILRRAVGEIGGARRETAQ